MTGSAQETQQLKQKIQDREFELHALALYKIVIEYIHQHPQEFKNLIKIAREIRKGLREDYDLVAAFTGREGSGKSTLMIILAILTHPSFNLEKNISMLPSTGEIKRMFRAIRRYGVLVIDEAIKILHKQDWYNVLQKVIVQMYATERFHNKATFLAIPRFTDLNENFRNHRVNVWFNVVDRGIAFMYVPIPVPFFSDPWLMQENAKRYDWLLKTKKGSQITIQDMLSIERRNPCFVDVVYFPDLPTEIKEAYLYLKTKSREKEEADESDELPKDKLRKALAMKIAREKEKGITNQVLCDEYALSKSSVQTLAREGRKWLRQESKQEGSLEEGAWTA